MKQISSRASAVIGRMKWIAIVGMIAGMVLLLLAVGFEWRGFWGGAVQGAAIGIIAAGAYFWGFGNGIGRGMPAAAWLPSQSDQA
ncbi:MULTISPECIES: hypothetical protein [unclassified Microbacterium]|uniref:hypothetical protein n=1 Tax=unclassified Microbacterium TaxID=2609290 RepID=UPI00214AAE58|nr:MULTISPECIES: hypothetical protein [unclassified Microbacterium]MCR2801379.1 hypothetical protein [Microbacterium sp. zg.Y818]MCR2825673.1 hypothetical protein [Microbacterium sp. zg.Y909]MCR2828277.1 hypothetical protein [Microbacterium sp. zg.Y909]WIM21204.1 hypothetical protein QNO21_08680 [Microbacterium sp. zg-Y818]